MKIPSVPQVQFITKEGDAHPQWREFFRELSIALQQNLSDEGYNIPPQSTDNITLLNNAKSVRNLVYDSTAHELKINLNGTFKTIQTM